LFTLDTIGSISPYALKKGRSKIMDKNQYMNIPYSFLAMFVGVVDGDGHISISKVKEQYIKISLVLSLHINDIDVLNYIQSVLKLGKINIYPKKGIIHNCKLVINKTDLQDIVFPLLLHHELFFLTKVRNEQFNKALFIMKNNLIYFKDIPILSFIREEILNSESILNLKFFDNWIIGFTIAEGSFLIKKNKDACYQLRQRTEMNLFQALKLKFKTDRKIGYDKNKLYCQLSVSSKKDIQTVIDFFSYFGNHPLFGLKLISY